MPHSIIIGAGWAGLSCGYYLSQAGHQVTILEAAPQTGGRARTVYWGDLAIDNGQHLAINAYHALQELLTALAVPLQTCFHITPMQIIVPRVGTLKLGPRRYFGNSNLHIVQVLLSNDLLTWREKLAAIKFCYAIHRLNFTLGTDCTVQELLQRHQQPASLIDKLWLPLALATMTTPIERGSAQVFLNVLRQALTSATELAWLLPKVDLSQVLPVHLERAIMAQQGRITCGQLITGLAISEQRCYGVNSKQQQWRGDHVILATPPVASVQLLGPHTTLQNLAACLQGFTYQPITTIYYRFEQAVDLGDPMVGFMRNICQWLFHRAFAAQPHILSAVISGPHPVKQQTADFLAQQVFAEIRSYFPALPEYVDFKVICEKRAAFDCNVQTQALRPGHRTAVSNLWLCGDYTQTWLPATLEGAIMSGKQAALEILSN